MGDRVLHCWADWRSTLEVGSEAWNQSWAGPNKTCLLPAGHAGPHEWTPDDEIRVRFT